MRSNVSEGSVAVVAVEILAAEVVHYVEIRPAVAVVVAPPAAETVARVVLVQARFRGYVAEGSITLVPHHEVGRAIFGIVIGKRIFVLVCSLVIGVETKINIQPAIAVVVGNGGAGESPLRGIGELERAGLLSKLSVAFIQEQKRTAGAHDDYILATAIVEVGKERARRIIEDAQARCFRDVFECPIAPVSIEAVRQARWLANVEVIETIIVDVGD